MSDFIACNICDSMFELCECGEDAETYTCDHPEGGPACPECGYLKDITEWEAYNLYEEGDHEENCPSCLKEYTVSVYVSHSWTSKRKVEGE